MYDINLHYYMKVVFKGNYNSRIMELDYDTLKMKWINYELLYGKWVSMNATGVFITGQPDIEYTILTKDEAFLELI